ncbi:hypothetical protein DFH29DRAFT_995792 [Suillus ampliporus]|nr:hypothetical protein DFH29DRAFT_995792 [Suillus ampliporus]
MATFSSDVLRKFARFFAQLFKSSRRQACYILRIFYALLRRLGSIRVRFDHGTYSAGTLHEELRPAICASGLPTIHIPAPDDDQPSDRPLRTLAVPMDIASPQRTSSFPPRSYLSSKYNFSTGTVDDDQVPNAIVSSEQPQIFLGMSTSAHESQFVFSGQTTDSVLHESIKLVSIIPTDVKRYDRKIRMKWVEPDPIVITPKDNKQVQHGWQNFVHPEGPRVYYHPERRVFTDADMRLGKSDSKTLLAIADALNAHSEVQARINDETELVLELDTGPSNRINSCGYYFVDHAKRMIFWAHAYTCEPGGEILFNIKAAKKHKYSLEAQYWLVLSKGSPSRYHCELYPHNRYLPRQVFEELREIIIHADAETITSDTSLAPFDGNELAKMLDLMDRVEGETLVKYFRLKLNVQPGSIDKMHAHSVCVVARFMRLFTKVKYMNFCGQPGARVDADRSIYYKEGHERETLIFRVSNLILWYAPRKHYKRIRRVWVDEVINAPRWKDFITQLDNEWTGFTLYSTVMLAVDVSFLAVPGIINSYGSSQTSTNIAVYMSALCSVGSLVVSLLLVGQSQDYQRQTAEGGALYMALMTSVIPGVENLALMHSLPFALLIWAMVFFGLALSILIFSTSDVVTLATMVPGWTIVMIFTLWPMMTTPIGRLLEVVRFLAHQPKRAVQYLRDSRHSDAGKALRTRNQVV